MLIPHPPVPRRSAHPSASVAVCKRFPTSSPIPSRSHQPRPRIPLCAAILPATPQRMLPRVGTPLRQLTSAGSVGVQPPQQAMRPVAKRSEVSPSVKPQSGGGEEGTLVVDMVGAGRLRQGNRRPRTPSVSRQQRTTRGMSWAVEIDRKRVCTREREATAASGTHHAAATSCGSGRSPAVPAACRNTNALRAMSDFAFRDGRPPSSMKSGPCRSRATSSRHSRQAVSRCVSSPWRFPPCMLKPNNQCLDLEEAEECTGF